MDILGLRIIMMSIALIGTLVFVLGLRNLLTANMFLVGPQYRKIFSDVTKIKSKKKENDKELEKEKKKQKAETRYINAANRMGISIPYAAASNYAGIGFIITLIVTLIATIMYFLFISVPNLLPGLMSTIVPILLGILTWKVMYSITVKPYNAVSSKKKEANRDMMEELSLLLSIMKNSREENIVTIFSSFEKSCKILKVDIQILLQDINVYGTRDALTKFSERLDSDVATRFAIAVKSVLDSSIENRGSTLALVEQDILNIINSERNKEMGRLTRIMNVIILGIFAVLILVVMYKTFGEVAVGLSEVF